MKKNYKLMGTESDPVIIAQRLLNLYRQLHIFSPEKKDAYNKMLIEQPAEIKRTLGTLPGGIVVQQYISDIEAEAGLNVEDFDDGGEYVADKNEDVVRSSSPAQSNVVFANDSEVVKGIVDAFKEVLVTSEKNRKEDTKELAQTIIALQSKLTQTMMEKQPVGSIGGSVSGGNIPQIEEIASGISRAQADLIKEMAQAQTQELSQLISQVLKEIQQMSTQTLIDAVQTVHRENMDFFKNKIFSSVSSVPMTPAMAESQETPYEYKETPHEQTPVNDLDSISPISLDDYEDDIVTPVEEAPQPAKYAASDESQSPAYNHEPQSDSDDDYEWEYVEDDGADDENGDYEWEYVEDDGANGENGDYEWEYVEDSTAPALSNDAEFSAEDVPLSALDDTGTDIYGQEDDAQDNPLMPEENEIQFDEKPSAPESIALNDDFGLSLDDDFGLSTDDDFGLSADDDFGLSADNETVA